MRVRMIMSVLQLLQMIVMELVAEVGLAVGRVP